MVELTPGQALEGTHDWNVGSFARGTRWNAWTRAMAGDAGDCALAGGSPQWRRFTFCSGGCAPQTASRRGSNGCRSAELFSPEAARGCLVVVPTPAGARPDCGYRPARRAATIAAGLRGQWAWRVGSSGVTQLVESADQWFPSKNSMKRKKPSTRRLKQLAKCRAGRNLGAADR